MMSTDLSCVYCPDDTMFRPNKIYILDGCSVCEPCLRKIQTSHDQADLDAKEVVFDKNMPAMTIKLFDYNGACLMTGPVKSYVIFEDEVTFPPIKISL